MFSLLKLKIIQSNFIQFSTKSKADVIKKLNYENKALFGPVIKKKTKKKNALKANTSSINIARDSEIQKINSDNLHDSERYWLIEQKHKKINGNGKESEILAARNEKVIEIKSLAESLNSIRSSFNSKQKSDDGNHKLGPKISSNETSPSLESSQSNKIINIPFNDNELHNILKFPLILNERNYFSGDNLMSSTINNNLPSSSMKLPSVGKILQATMSEKSRKALINWKLTKIAELGEDGFKNLQQELLQQGKLFHKALQEYLESYETPTIDPSIDGVWNSVVVALDSLKPETKLIEAPVEHPYLKYCGIVDYVSYVSSNLSVIEWKKSNKIKNRIDFTYDAPIQLCAYLGALNVDARYQIEANDGFVVIAYTDGQPADVHRLDKIQLQKYWNLWLQRLQEYWIRLRDGTLPEPI